MSRAMRAVRLIGKATKFLLVIFVFSIIAFLVWRAFISTKIPDEVADLYIDDALSLSIEEEGGLSSAFCQDQRSITSTERNYGYFSVEKTVFLPSANSLQMLARYNNSTIRATQRDYGLDAVPDGEVYDVSVVIVIDKTPENKDDNLTGANGSTEEVRLFPKRCDAASTRMYNYRRFVFDFGEYDLEKMISDGTLIAVFADCQR